MRSVACRTSGFVLLSVECTTSSGLCFGAAALTFTGDGTKLDSSDRLVRALLKVGMATTLALFNRPNSVGDLVSLCVALWARKLANLLWSKLSVTGHICTEHFLS